MGLNWGRALTGASESIGNVLETEQRNKEMAWEEARQIRLENLRAKNRESADKKQAGYRLTEVELRGDLSMDVARQTNEWAKERADTLYSRQQTQDDKERERFVADEQRKNTISYGAAKAKLVTLREKESMSGGDAISGLPSEVLGSADSGTLLNSMFTQSGSGYKLSQKGFDSAMKALDDSYAYVDASLTMSPEQFKALSEGVKIAGTMDGIKVAISEMTKGEPLTAQNVADSIRPPDLDKLKEVSVTAERRTESPKKTINPTPAENQPQDLTPELSMGGKASFLGKALTAPFVALGQAASNMDVTKLDETNRPIYPK